MFDKAKRKRLESQIKQMEAAIGAVARGVPTPKDVKLFRKALKVEGKVGDAARTLNESLNKRPQRNMKKQEQLKKRLKE